MAPIDSAERKETAAHPRLFFAALLITAILAAVFIALPAYSLLGQVYSWHLEQPETIQGGIELLIVLLLLSLAASLIRIPRLSTSLILLITILYLQMHSVLIPAALAWLYMEGFMQAGIAFQKLIRMGDRHPHNLVSCLGRLVIGIAVWTIGALILSAVGFGSIPDLRIYSAGLAFCSLVVARSTPFGVVAIRSFEQLNTRNRILVIVLALLVLTQFGKINYGGDYDSMWYGIRPERVLVGAHSIFDDLKLMHHVYYYPKQFEILTLPLAKLNNGGFIVPFNTLLFAFSLLAIYLTGRELQFKPTNALFLTAMAGSIPALCNMGSTAKTDTLMCLYAFVAVLFLWRWCKSHKAIELCYGLAALVGMMGTKISAYAYAPLLLSGFLVVGLWMKFAVKPPISPELSDPELELPSWKRSPLIVLLVALSAFVGLMVRSWLLTGIPTMPAFMDKWILLGISPKYPWNMTGFVFSGVPIESTKEFFTYWGRLLFDPKLYSHFTMAWPGNAGFFFACMLVIFASVGAVRRNRETAFLIACLPAFAGGILTACLVRTPNQGFTDGNYYAIPVILTILGAAGMLASSPKPARTVMTVCGTGFMLLQIPVMFVSHWSWHPGTQPFRFSLSQSLFDRKSDLEARIRNAGAWELEAYLRAHPGKGLCVGFANGQEAALHMLSCIHEDFEQTAPPFWLLFDSNAAFRKYLDWARPDIFIMPKSPTYSPCAPGTPVRKIFDELAAAKNVIRIESRNYTALDLSNFFDSSRPLRSARQH